MGPGLYYYNLPVNSSAIDQRKEKYSNHKNTPNYAGFGCPLAYGNELEFQISYQYMLSSPHSKLIPTAK